MVFASSGEQAERGPRQLLFLAYPQT